MSIKLMTAIWYTEFIDLPTGEKHSDNKDKFVRATSAKITLLAIADQANDEGESAYPGYTRLELKTGLSRQGVADVIKALRYNGIVSTSEIPSKLNTNNYKINLSCFPRLHNENDRVLVVNSLDQSSHLTSASQATLPKVVKPLDLKHTLNVQETSTDGLKTDEEKPRYSTAYQRGEQERPDKLSAALEMSNFPGAKQQARIDSILSYLGSVFQVNTERKDWKEFAKYVDGQKQTLGWDVSRFVTWLKAKPDFSMDYWTARRMMEHYPRAFETSQIEQPTDRTSLLRTL